MTEPVRSPHCSLFTGDGDGIYCRTAGDETGCRFDSPDTLSTLRSHRSRRHLQLLICHTHLLADSSHTAPAIGSREWRNGTQAEWCMPGVSTDRSCYIHTQPDSSHAHLRAQVTLVKTVQRCVVDVSPKCAACAMSCSTNSKRHQTFCNWLVTGTRSIDTNRH